MTRATPTAPTGMSPCAPPRAITRIRQRYAADLPCLPSGEPTQANLYAALQALQDKGYSTTSAQLRVLRQLVFERLYTLDCEASAPLGVVIQGMTDLAEVCLRVAAQTTHAELVKRHGEPLCKGKPSVLWTIGMGKLGARELNVSSDIDLIFVYDSDGETNAPSPEQTSISNHAFFAAQVRLIKSLIADVTEHGFVFRLDLALRPYGSEGALAVSLSTLAQYFQRSGREWERFAWLKSRVIPTHTAPEDVLPLRAVVRSFVFRRFLDFKVFAALRELHGLIRKQVDSKDGPRDIKLGHGGIREIEFAAQVMQIVRGGRQPELLARPTLTALDRLEAAGLMDADTATTLRRAYIFLRQLEHRIQYLDDAQTHNLPASQADMAWVAQRMGFADIPLFQNELAQHRQQVSSIFEQWLQKGLGQELLPAASALPIDPTAPPVTTVTTELLQRKAAWTVSYLRKHPDAADELKRPDVLTTRFDATTFQKKVRLQYLALQATGLCDEEALLDLLRRAHHSEVFKILVRDVQGLLSVRDVGDELSALADSILSLALPWCWNMLQAKLRGNLQGSDLAERFAVIAYGKLGGKELGYGSDLDIVFLYDDDSDIATERYTALVRKLIAWLTAKTSEGDLYEIDTALRPNGNSGLLVTSLASYEKYQLQRGSNTAWTWELQAMTRARCVCGSARLQARFDDIRSQVLQTPRDPALLKAEVLAMRQKLYAAHPTSAGTFDIKHSPGGMMDVEFAVQYLVLAHAKDHPALLGNLGNIELLRMAQAAQLLPIGIGVAAADAYHILRDQQHAARLQETKAVLGDDALMPEREAIQALWRTVFEA